MNIQDTCELKRFAAERLENAREERKIVLIYTGITIAVTALVTIINYCLDLQIAQTGGLGNIGTRSMLSTLQHLLPLAQTLFLMCLDLGYLSAMFRIARGQYASPNGLRLGFDRFWVLLRCSLLKGLIYCGIGMLSLYAAMIVYFLTPLSASALEIMISLIEASSLSGNMRIAMDEATYAQLLSAMAPALILWGVFFLVIAAPFYYKYRMANYLLIDRPAIGAFAALRESQKMMKGNRLKLLRLDLSMWWFYAALLLAVLMYDGDVLLAMLGVTLPFSGSVSYFLFFAGYLAAILVIYCFLRNRVEVTYALAYDALRPREPENTGAVLGNIFTM